MGLFPIIYHSLITSTLTYAAPAAGHAPTVFFKRLQISQNKVLGMITKLLGVTPTDILHEQTAMETVGGYVTRTASKFYFKNQFSDNEQIRQLG
jgi:hypothetical protein